MSGDYKYVDVPLSPSLFGRLALELFPGRMMRRADLAIAVNQHHISNGGAKGTQPIDRIAKRALSSLAKVGAAENVEGGYGMWRLTGTPTSQHEPAPTHATPAPVPPPGPAGKSDNAGNGKRIPHDHDSPAESDLDPTETDYAYGGIPLTPSLAGRLAMQLFGGQVIRRNAIIEAVMDYHLSRGGQPPTMEPADAIRTGLSDLARNGLVESVDGAYGMWRFPDQGESIRIAYEQHTTEPEPTLEPEVSYNDSLTEVETDDADIHYVYVYDLPAYASLAEATGKSHWPHKVGFTRLTPEARISAQVGTALPEHPRLVLSVKHPRALQLECALHAVLELRGRKIDGPGAEWFVTNPKEITALVDLLLKSDVLDS